MFYKLVVQLALYSIEYLVKSSKNKLDDELLKYIKEEVKNDK